MCIGRKEWTVPVSCPRCGVDLIPINGCVPSQTLAVAVVYCATCHHEYELAVRVTDRGYVQAKDRTAA